MKQWKYILTVLLLLALMLTVVSCGNGQDKDPDDLPITPDEEQPEQPTPPADTDKQDPADDGELTVEDFDTTRVYEAPRYFEMDLSEYVTLGRYHNLTLTISAADVTVTDDMLQKEIELMLEQNHPDAKITDRAVEWGDTVIVTYVGSRDGVPFSGGSASNQSIKISEQNTFIPGFVEGIVGLMPGVETPVPMTFPENYHNAELAGADVVFTFTVSYIEGHPELTDEFVNEYTQGKYTTNIEA